jgi:hypothetical protein
MVGGQLAETAKALRGGLPYDRNIGRKWFLNTFNNYYENDAFQNLKLRFVAGGGLGYHPIKGERVGLEFLAGADCSREHCNIPVVFGGGNPSDTRQSGEA